jgi:hypothetical protein
MRSSHQRLRHEELHPEIIQVLGIVDLIDDPATQVPGSQFGEHLRFGNSAYSPAKPAVISSGIVFQTIQ